MGEKEIERELKKLLSTKYVTFLRFLQHRIIFIDYREKIHSYNFIKMTIPECLHFYGLIEFEVLFLLY